ncbi:MAG: HNH endonuclease [Acidimicrobiales bacterium]|nr:HNH endonuclease [Acidimicrobiales bacterium]
MGRALVLNGSYEPLGVVNARRALVLVLDEKADVLHHSGEQLRSQCLVVDVPSVIRLRYVVKVPYQRRVTLSRRAVLHRDGNRCQYCGKDADSIDHVVPRSRGGTHTWENVVAACRRCNLAKGSRLVSETTMVLRRPPVQPRQLSWLLITLDRIPEHWKPYLGEQLLSA